MLLFQWVIKKSSFIVGLLYALIHLYSCSTSSSTAYLNDFSKDTTVSVLKSVHQLDIVNKNDEVEIAISSLNPELDEKFNNSGLSSSQVGSRSIYKVDNEGKIKLHHLGSISVEGLTLKQLSAKLESDLNSFYKDLIVSAKFVNKRIAVIGQVNNPKVVAIPEGGMSIFELIANCGDLKPDADIRNILILRDSGDKKQVGVVNLSNNSIFESKWYQLTANDVVVVRKDDAKAMKSDKKREIQSNVSLAVSLLSLGAIILNLIIK